LQNNGKTAAKRLQNRNMQKRRDSGDKSDGVLDGGPLKIRLACDLDQLSPFVEWRLRGILPERPVLTVKALGDLREGKLFPPEDVGQVGLVHLTAHA
jgi:hypothetical protein